MVPGHEWTICRWKAAEKEIITLEEMDAWDVIEHEDDMNVIDETWALKCKQYPNGTVKKFKAGFFLMEVSSWKELIYLRPMPLLCNGPLSA